MMGIVGRAVGDPTRYVSILARRILEPRRDWIFWHAFWHEGGQTVTFAAPLLDLASLAGGALRRGAGPCWLA